MQRPEKAVGTGLPFRSAHWSRLGAATAAAWQPAVGVLVQWEGWEQGCSTGGTWLQTWWISELTPVNLSSFLLYGCGCGVNPTPQEMENMMPT